MRHATLAPFLLAIATISTACQTTHVIPAKTANTDHVVTTYDAAPETTTEYALYEPGSINERVLARGQKSRQVPSLSYVSEYDSVGEDLPEAN